MTYDTSKVLADLMPTDHDNMTYELPEVLVDFMTLHIVYDSYDYNMTYD